MYLPVQGMENARNETIINKIIATYFMDVFILIFHGVHMGFINISIQF